MEKKSLFQKLLAIQEAVDGFTKDAKGYGYDYVDGNQVLSAIRPLMNANKLLLKQEVIQCDNTVVSYQSSKGTKTEVLSAVKMRFTWIDAESGETDVSEFFANGMNDFDKGLGSALTYGERYYLLKFFHIPTDGDDPDKLGKKSEETKSQHKGQQSQQSKPATGAKELPWLDEGTENYSKVEAYLKKEGTIDDIKKKYRLNKVILAKLELIIKTRGK